MALISCVEKWIAAARKNQNKVAGDKKLAQGVPWRNKKLASGRDLQLIAKVAKREARTLRKVCMFCLPLFPYAYDEEAKFTKSTPTMFPTCSMWINWVSSEFLPCRMDTCEIILTSFLHFFKKYMIILFLKVLRGGRAPPGPPWLRHCPRYIYF